MNRRAADISDLNRFPAFAALAEEHQHALGDCCRVLDLKSGEVLFVPAQPADDFFIILGGRMHLYKLSSDGKRQIVHHLGAGAPFAEAAAFAKKTYPVFAESLTKTTLLAVNVKCFSSFLKKQPEICLQLLAGVFEKVRQLTNLVEALSLKSVPARVAGVLLEYMPAGREEGQWFTLSLSKTAMADSLGTTPETISRVLRKFKDTKIIEEKSSAKLRILNLQHLRCITEGDSDL